MLDDLRQRHLHAALVPVGPLAAAVARVERFGGFERGEAALPMKRLFKVVLP